MVVGIGIITLRLYDIHSLKEKRKIVKSMIAKIQNSFNASVAETSLQDNLEMAEIGFSMVGNNRMVINSKIDKIFNYADEMGLAVIEDTEMELINL